jgi:hypothetical protein
MRFWHSRAAILSSILSILLSLITFATALADDTPTPWP